MALVNFTNLDFDQIKVSIRDYLKSNSNFTDYDFEGSNLSTTRSRGRRPACRPRAAAAAR